MHKMPKLKMSLLVKVASIFLVVGVAVLSLGFLLGPSSYIFFDRGLKTGNNVQETSIDEQTVPFNQIVFDYADFNEISIETGDSYHVQIKSKRPYFTPNYTLQGGVLTIGADVEQKKSTGRILEITPNSYDAVAVITVPENASLSLVDVHTMDMSEDYFYYSSALFSDANVEFVSLDGLKIDQLSFANDVDLKIDDCTIGTFSREESQNFRHVDVTAQESTFEQVVLLQNENGPFSVNFNDCTMGSLKVADADTVFLMGGTIRQADVTAQTFECKDVQFTDLKYDVSMAILRDCEAVNIDGTAVDQNDVALNGNSRDYTLDLQALPAVEVVEKTVDYTDPLYIYGYDTQETAKDTVTVTDDDENYTNLFENGAYITENTQTDIAPDGSTDEQQSIVVYAKRMLRYFVQDGTTYYDVGSDNMGMWNNSAVTLFHDEFEEKLAEINCGGVYVNGQQVGTEAYTADGTTGGTIRLKCSNSKVLLAFSEE